MVLPELDLLVAVARTRRRYHGGHLIGRLPGFHDGDSEVGIKADVKISRIRANVSVFLASLLQRRRLRRASDCGQHNRGQQQGSHEICYAGEIRDNKLIFIVTMQDRSAHPLQPP
jgi:hypothetical protein